MRKIKSLIKCVVNADDFGISKGVNEAIVNMMEARRVTSATIMANGEAFEDAVAAARELRGTFGVHLNLTQFSPLSKTEHLRPLLNDRNEFVGDIRNRFLGPSLQRAIFEEFQLQFDRVRQAIGRVSHIDSHHHVHTLPLLLPLLIAFVKTNNIRAVRLSKTLYRRGTVHGLSIGKRLWNATLRQVCRSRGCDYFSDIHTLLDNLNKREEFTVEIVAHPGHPSFALENEILATEWRRGLAADISLVDYDEIAGGG